MPAKAEEVKFPYFDEGTIAWLDGKTSGAEDEVWSKVKVLTQNGPLVTVRLLSSKSNQSAIHVDLRVNHLEMGNPDVESDLTALHYMNEASILQNLQERSYKDEPYTFMGNVMVAVNPLKYGLEPADVLGKSAASRIVHPFAVAEIAYNQMCFRGNQMRREVEDRVNQSIVTSGESGSGKTESTKLLMRHLVYRAGVDSAELTTRMLESNTILEAFGNCGTLRNHNSSRFGKFMKLWFNQNESKVGELPSFSIERASIETYLLEQSRITLHGFGEHNFHVFYYLLSGDDDLKAQFKLTNHLKKKEANKYGFRYLDPVDLDDMQTGNRKKKKGKKKEASTSVSADLARAHDAAHYQTLIIALEEYGMEGTQLSEVLSIVAAVLHLGNIMFHEKPATHTDLAEEDTSMYDADYSPLHVAADILQTTPENLNGLLTTRTLVVRGETSNINLSSKGAAIARDSMCRLLYTGLFDWIVARLNTTLGGDAEDDENKYFIGMLDIFGFEVFQMNTFEQLLINYANEALQGTFDRSVFINELELYRKEGLLKGNEEDELVIPDNTPCLELFEGPHVHAKGVRQGMEIGLLKLIDAESQLPKPSDEKMNATFHRVYDSNKFFGRIHPNDRRDKFIVVHYAGAVVYTVGSFVKKNRNGFLKPEDMVTVLSQCGNGVVSDIMETTGAVYKAANARHVRPKTVVGKFSSQIHALINTLESTNTSFIRCIKPNPSLSRPKNSKTWFNRKYVSAQLTTLSIPQTVKVLSTGYPTRIPYKTLLEKYKGVLPADALKIWETKSGGNNKAFVEAVFYAFGVERATFKMGYTKIFFKAGQIADLERVLSASEKWKAGKDGASEADFVKRFKRYYIRKQWRVAFAKVLAMNRFAKMAIAVHERREAERLERERLERLRRAKLRRKWRVAILFVRAQVRFKRLFAEVHEKALAAEAERKAREAAMSEEERKAKEAEEQAKLEEQEKAAAEEGKKELAKAESVKVLINKKLDEENDEIARIEEKEKETIAKIEKQRSMHELPKEVVQETVKEEEKEEPLSVEQGLRRYDPFGRLTDLLTASKNQVLEAVGVKTKEQVIQEEAMQHVQEIQTWREAEQEKLNRQVQERLRALNIDIDLDDEDFKAAGEKDKEDAKKLVAIEAERLKLQTMMEEAHEEESKEETPKEETPKEDEELEATPPPNRKPSSAQVVNYDTSIFDWKKHVVGEDDTTVEGKPVVKEMIGRVYYYNEKTGAARWDAPKVQILVEEDSGVKESKEMIRKAKELAEKQVATETFASEEERATKLENLKKKYIHDLAINNVAMESLKHEGALSKFYHRFKDTHWFKHHEKDAHTALDEAEKKHKGVHHRSSMKDLLTFSRGKTKKSHEHVVDDTNNTVKKVVVLTGEQVKNPVLALRQHAEAMDKLAETGALTPVELNNLKMKMADTGKQDKVQEKIDLKKDTKVAAMQVHCPNCDSMINTATSHVCANCGHHLKPGTIAELKTVDRTDSDEALDKAHYEKTNWDLVLDIKKGKIRIRIANVKTEFDEMSARDLTFFETEIVMENTHIKNKKTKEKRSSFKKWLVLHSFTEYMNLSVDINSGQLGKEHLKKGVRNAIKAISPPSASTSSPYAVDYELIVDAEAEKYKKLISNWLGLLKDKLRSKDKRFGRPLFASPEVDAFFEITDHVPDSVDAAFW